MTMTLTCVGGGATAGQNWAGDRETPDSRRWRSCAECGLRWCGRGAQVARGQHIFYLILIEILDTAQYRRRITSLGSHG